MILLILMTLKITTATETIETYICHGKEENYRCYKYNGRDPDVYDYTSRKKSSIHVYEFDDSGTRNPYAPADDEPGRLDKNAKDDKNKINTDLPVFIPYNPVYLFPDLFKKE